MRRCHRHARHHSRHQGGRGAQTRRHGGAGRGEYDACQAYAKQRAEDEGRTFVPPFDDPLVVAGQGTVGLEVVRQLPSLEAIFVPVGGGGLIAGIAAYVKSIRPDVKVIGVEPEGANAMLQSLHHGEICRLSKVDGFADGVAVRQVGDVCFDLCQQLVDGVMTVKTDAICAAIKDVFAENRSILEPAGAVAVAGAKAYCETHGITGNVVAITSGANMNFDRLRVVSQLADGGLKQGGDSRASSRRRTDLSSVSSSSSARTSTSPSSSTA